LGDYLYTVTEDEVYSHLYIGSHANLTMKQTDVELIQVSNLPWDGNVSLEVRVEKPINFTIGLRIPRWTKGEFELMVNGTAGSYTMKNGYAMIRNDWETGDIIEIIFPMGVKLMQAHASVKANSGKITIERGPLIYCLEEEDNGKNLNTIIVNPDRNWNVIEE